VIDVSEWEKDLNEVREALKALGWETHIEAYYSQGEETETFRKGERYLHIAYGDVADLDFGE
jgi:hypothetical protein